MELGCEVCGKPLLHGDRYCPGCGAAVGEGGTQRASATREAGAERRLVSVLFADLVGFTTLSERRDPDEVRDLLSRYFERCRELIERYGGTVEKFIGDAVMAVWGTPVAREDDAERAVRAALALTAAVSALGDEVGMAELRARAGVLTGTAAVDIGAEHEGMVVGDTVNTASRLQSVAAPGSVLVDDVTHRASEAAIAYEDGGSHEVKGREQPLHAWRAMRVVAGAAGARRSVGLEAPFVGRENELARIVAAGEESAQEGSARLVTVVGDAGAGKSRLLWEFFKYLDGIEQERWWHQGRCLSYGEGVGYWALAEMVRSRAGIVEEEPPALAREKLHAAVVEHVADERERRLVEPRLAHLLRLEERAEADRADLFSGWRLFFERLAARHPVILAFEDLQWADSGLLDFIDYLLEWSAALPILVIALARPELRERRPGWPMLALEPLPRRAIETILEGSVPGLPAELLVEIGRRSEGIPLYAVETIRMLQDRGVLVQEGARYVLTGDVSELEVPETLHALVASRLDGLTTGERSLLQDASVLGQSFTAAAAAAVGEWPESEVRDLLDGLVVKQILGRDDDPRSPERGSFVFLQALVRTVAYGTLPRRARKERHLAAAAYLSRTWPGETRDIAEVLASHHLEAIRVDPDADDVAELRAVARETLAQAGRATASLALGPEAVRYFEQAAELAEEDLERAALLEEAGRVSWRSGDTDAGERRLRAAIELHERSGSQAGGSAAVTLAEAMHSAGRLDEARKLLEPFRAGEDASVDRIVHAKALAGLGAVLTLAGAVTEAAQLYDEALGTLEQEQAWPALTNALVGHGVLMFHRHRMEEGIAVTRHAVSLAEQHDLPAVALRARYNLAGAWLMGDHFTEAMNEVDAALVIARERGDRPAQRQLLGQAAAPLAMLGRWDELVPIAEQLMSGEFDVTAIFAASFAAQVASARGDMATLERCRSIAEREWDSSYIDQRDCAAVILARDALERGSPEDALRHAQQVLTSRGTASEVMEEAYAVSVEAAMAVGDEAAIAELVAVVAALPPVRETPLLRAGRARLTAELRHRGEDPEGAIRSEDEALALLRSVGAKPLLARTLCERAGRRESPEASAEARSIYTELRASRRLSQADDSSAAPATSSMSPDVGG